MTNCVEAYEYYRDLEIQKILKTQPSRELDFLVATKVMRLTEQEFIREQMCYGNCFYSVDMSSAWEVVEYLRNEHNLKIVLEMKLHNGFYIYIKNDMGGNITGLYEFKTAPEAICKIACLALMT